MPRRLLNIASVACLVACVALMGLWVRSYYQYSDLRGRIFGTNLFVIGVPSGRMRSTTLELKSTQSGIPTPYTWPWAIGNKPAIVFSKSPVGRGYLASLGVDLDRNAQFRRSSFHFGLSRLCLAQLRSFCAFVGRHDSLSAACLS